MKNKEFWKTVIQFAISILTGQNKAPLRDFGFAE